VRQLPDGLCQLLSMKAMIRSSYQPVLEPAYGGEVILQSTLPCLPIWANPSERLIPNEDRHLVAEAFAVFGIELLGGLSLV
jgi:hypothetical protein